MYFITLKYKYPITLKRCWGYVHRGQVVPLWMPEICTAHSSENNPDELVIKTIKYKVLLCMKYKVPLCIKYIVPLYIKLKVESATMDARDLHSSFFSWDQSWWVGDQKFSVWSMKILLCMKYRV